jgi:hypothetical protein
MYKFLSSLLLSFICSTSLMATELVYDRTETLPVMDLSEIMIDSSVEAHDYGFIKDAAQYGGANWSNVLGVAKGITTEQAKAIADNNPEITSFFYTKGGRMILVADDGGYYVFHHGDTVFFDEPVWWAWATDLADGYTKTPK